MSSDHDLDINRPIPDPTVLTTQQITERVKAERDYVDGQIEVMRQRLAGIDKATELLNETVNRVPTDLQTAIGRLNDLIDERFKSIAVQFKERDTRQERESRDNKVAVDAAFAAQKEAAAKQEETFTKQIDKSELATKETIIKLQDLTTTQDKALSDKQDDLKARVTGIESIRLGSHEQKIDSRLSMGAIAGLIASAVAVISLIVLFVPRSASVTPTLPQVVTVTVPKTP